MTNDVESIVLALWHDNTASGTNIIAKKTQRICRRRGLAIPAESTVRHYLDSLPEAVKMTRGGRFDLWDKQAKPTIPFQGSRYANQRHQSDHKRMDLHSRIMVDGEWRPVQLWLTPLLDDYSRAIVGRHITVGSANSWSITQAIRHAAMPKEEIGWEVCGLPEIFQCDNGADFLSGAVQTALATLKVTIDVDPPHYPNRKGKIERFFRTLDQGCLRGLPGHMADIGTSEGAAKKHLMELLTPEDILKEIDRWIIEDYHQRTHSETGEKPIDRWRNTVRLRVPDEGEVARVLLRLESTSRLVQRTVSFTKNGEGGSYWSLKIPDLYHERVRVAYNPEDMRRIAIHSEETGEYHGELWLLGHPDCPFDEEMVKATGARYKNGLKTRINGYLALAKELEEELKVDEEVDSEVEEIVEELDSKEDEAGDADQAEEQEIRDIIDELDSY